VDDTEGAVGWFRPFLGDPDAPRIGARWACRAASPADPAQVVSQAPTPPATLAGVVCDLIR